MPSVRGVDLRRELAKNPPDGLTPVHSRLRSEALALIESEDLVEASYSYNIVPLDRPAEEMLHVGGEQLYAPTLLPESGELTALGFGVCTLGPKLEARSTSLFRERRASLSVALEYVASEMLFALERRVQDRMLSECYRRRLSMAGELHAGDPGLDITAQATVLRQAEADGIGVGLYGSHLLTPVKSTSMVLGVGKNLPATSWSRCDTCPSRNKCNFGRRPAHEERMVA